MVVDKVDKKAVVVDEEVPKDSNIRKQEQEKLEKYQNLREQLEWRPKTTAVPMVTGAFKECVVQRFQGTALVFVDLIFDGPGGRKE